MAIDDFSVALIRLKLDAAPSGGGRKHYSPWFYAGIITVGVVFIIAVAILVITLVVTRRRNALEGEHDYHLLTAPYSPTDGDGYPSPLSPGNTSINPVAYVLVEPRAENAHRSSPSPDSG
jgi:hypothetical protein